MALSPLQKSSTTCTTTSSLHSYRRFPLGAINPVTLVAAAAGAAMLCFRRTLSCTATATGAGGAANIGVRGRSGIHRYHRRVASSSNLVGTIHPAFISHRYSTLHYDAQTASRIQRQQQQDLSSLHQPYLQPFTENGCSTSSGRSPRHLSVLNQGLDIGSRETSPNDDDGTAELLSQYSHLPRIYVDTSSSTSSSSSSSLAPDSLVTLSSSQSHYLKTVMRISNRKRWGDLINHVRIFDGSDGEWLAQLLATEPPDEVSSNTSRRRRRRQVQDDDALAIVQCIKCLVPQPSTTSTQNSFSSSKVTLWMPSPKKQRRKWILEKVTELGVDGIGFIQTEYSQDDWKSKDRPDENNTSKDLVHVIEAAEQCERYTIPNIILKQTEDEGDNEFDERRYSPMTLTDIIESKWTMMNARNGDSDNDNDAKEDNDCVSKDDNVLSCWLICRERSPTSDTILQVLEDIMGISSDLSKQYSGVDINLLIGPEGGWSPAEIEQMETISQHAKENNNSSLIIRNVSLGPQVLRAESAAITAVATIMMHQDYSMNKNPRNQ